MWLVYNIFVLLLVYLSFLYIFCVSLIHRISVNNWSSVYFSESLVTRLFFSIFDRFQCLILWIKCFSWPAWRILKNNTSSLFATFGFPVAASRFLKMILHENNLCVTLLSSCALGNSLRWNLLAYHTHEPLHRLFDRS